MPSGSGEGYTSGTASVIRAVLEVCDENIAKTGKKLKEPYDERVEILRIEYANGSTWQRPAK